MWENFGSACVIEHRAGIAADGRILAWDRENWVASLGNRPGYDRPGNVISGMLVGYPSGAAQARPGQSADGQAAQSEQHRAGLLRRMHRRHLRRRRHDPE